MCCWIFHNLKWLHAVLNKGKAIFLAIQNSPERELLNGTAVSQDNICKIIVCVLFARSKKYIIVILGIDINSIIHEQTQRNWLYNVHMPFCFHIFKYFTNIYYCMKHIQNKYIKNNVKKQFVIVQPNLPFTPLG